MGGVDGEMDGKLRLRRERLVLYGRGEFKARACGFDMRDLDRLVADVLQSEGFNIRFLKPREDGDEPVPYLPVKVAYGKGRPPKVVMVTKRGKTDLDEDSIKTLDWAEIEKADIAINPYEYDVQGRHGIKAYLKTMYVTIQEDDFEDRYYDVPESAKSILVDESV